MECHALELVSMSEMIGDGTKPISQNVWHARLGHLPLKILNNLDKCVDRFKMIDSANSMIKRKYAEDV